MKTWIRALGLWLLIVSWPGVAHARGDGPPPEDTSEVGLEVIDRGVADGYVRKPLALRLRRSATWTWVTRGLLFTSEIALLWAYSWDTPAVYVFLWPSFAVTTALLSVSQSRRGLREHRGEPATPSWRTAGILAVCTGTVVALAGRNQVSSEVTYSRIATAQLVGTLMIQLQGWRYRRDIKGKPWPVWIPWLEAWRARRDPVAWVPVVTPTPGGALLGAAVVF